MGSRPAGTGCWSGTERKKVSGSEHLGAVNAALSRDCGACEWKEVRSVCVLALLSPWGVSAD